MRAVAYIRVSTSEQAESGLGLDAQREVVTAMALVKRWTLIGVVADAGESAKSMDRPGLREVLAQVRGKAVDAVIIAKLDRLTRNMRDLSEMLEEFAKRGVKLISTEEGLDTSTAMGELVLNIMGSIAQWERKANGERTSAALQALKAQGKRAGAVPYGKTADEDGYLHDNPEEQAVLKRIRELRAGGHSFQVVADTLSEEGIRTRRGAAFTKAGVHYLARKVGVGIASD